MDDTTPTATEIKPVEDELGCVLLLRRCFRNLLLVTGPQLLFAKALALDLSYVEVTEAKFGGNLLLPKPLY